MSRGKAAGVVAGLVLLGVSATVVVASLATNNATGYAPDPRAWFLTLIIPLLLTLGVTAYYSDQEPY